MSCKIEQQFKVQLIGFIDELIDLLPSEPVFISARVFLSTNQNSDKEIIDKFVHSINTNNKSNLLSIKNRDCQFFVDNELFSFFNGDIFRKFWNRIDKSDQNTLWQWIDSFVELSEAYSTL
jgi:hypothetical protein